MKSLKNVYLNILYHSKINLRFKRSFRNKNGPSMKMGKSQKDKRQISTALMMLSLSNYNCEEEWNADKTTKQNTYMHQCGTLIIFNVTNVGWLLHSDILTEPLKNGEKMVSHQWQKQNWTGLLRSMVQTSVRGSLSFKKLTNLGFWPNKLIQY